MNKKLIITLLFLLFIYYFLTFIISFGLIANSVSKNNHILLKKYILTNEIYNNFYLEIFKLKKTSLDKINKNINISTDSFEFTGQLTNNFKNKLFNKIAKKLSLEFSNPEIMLYFYFNSNEINKYIIELFNNLG